MRLELERRVNLQKQRVSSSQTTELDDLNQLS